MVNWALNLNNMRVHTIFIDIMKYAYIIIMIGTISLIIYSLFNHDYEKVFISCFFLLFFFIFILILQLNFKLVYIISNDQKVLTKNIFWGKNETNSFEHFSLTPIKGIFNNFLGYKSYYIGNTKKRLLVNSYDQLRTNILDQFR